MKFYKNFLGVSFEIEGKYYIYEAFNNNLLLVDKIVADIIDGYFEGVEDKLYENFENHYKKEDIRKCINYLNEEVKKGTFSNFKIPNFAVSKKTSIVDLVKKKLNNELEQLILNVTDACNMRCKYCVYSGEYENMRIHNTKNHLPSEIAKKAIDIFLKNSKKSEKDRFIGFYGGESLIKIDLIKELVDYTKNKTNNIYFVLNSNGILLGEEVIDYICNNDIRLTISLDGPESIHNLNRVSVDGSGTFNKIFQNLMIIKEKYPGYFARQLRINAVVVPNEEEFIVLSDFFKNNFPELLEKDFVSFIYISSAKNSYTEKNNYGDYLKKLDDYVDCEYFENITEDIDKKKYYLSYSLRARMMKTIHFRCHRPLSSYSYFWPNGICVPGLRSIFVRPDGKFLPCEKIATGERYTIGDTENGLNYNKITDLISQYCDNIQNDCTNCWAYRLCGECFVSLGDNSEDEISKRKRMCNGIRREYVDYLKLYIRVLEKNPHSFDHWNYDDDSMILNFSGE